MKPWVTRRDFSTTLAHFRRAIGLVRWARAGGTPVAPLPAGVEMPERGWGSSHTPEIDAWEAWLAANRDLVPGDLLPPIGQEYVYCIVLAAVSLPNVERMTNPKEAQLRSLLADTLTYLAMEGLPGGVRSVPPHVRRRALDLIDTRAGRQDAVLYSMVWWAARDVKVDGRWGDSSLRFLWRTVAHAMTERFTLDEVWSARARLLAAL